MRTKSASMLRKSSTWKLNDNGNNDKPYRYNVTTVITVTSNKVDLVRGLIASQGELLKQGIAISGGDYRYNVSYDYTSIEQIKLR